MARLARLSHSGGGSSGSPDPDCSHQATRPDPANAARGRCRLREPGAVLSLDAYERDYDDSRAQVANPRHRRECIDTLELVFDHRVNPNLSLRASLHHWTKRDLITLGINPVSGLLQFQSGDTVRAQGAELSADKTWDSGTRLRDSISMQKSHSQHDAPILNNPELLDRIKLSGPLPTTGLRIGNEFCFDSQRRGADGTTLGGNALSSLLQSNDSWFGGLDMSLGLFNLFDKHHAIPGADNNWQGAIDQVGSSIRYKLTYRF